MKHYSQAVKLRAVQLYIEEGKSQAEIIEELGINNVRRVKQWLHAYRQEGKAAFKQKGRGRLPKKENREAYIARLEMEIDLLKKFHAELRQEELAKRNFGSSTAKKKDTK
jgi:transposase-like protein